MNSLKCKNCGEKDLTKFMIVRFEAIDIKNEVMNSRMLIYCWNCTIKLEKEIIDLSSG